MFKPKSLTLITSILVSVVVLAIIGLLGYAQLGDLSVPQSEVTIPVTLGES